MDDIYWPGTRTPKSRNNAFTHGWLGKPHGFEPGPVQPTVVKLPERRAIGFAKNGGTIPSMNPRSSGISIKRQA